ncbi:unnamed protein product, partial [Amoebophrya sp. A25]
AGVPGESVGSVAAEGEGVATTSIAETRVEEAKAAEVAQDEAREEAKAETRTSAEHSSDTDQLQQSQPPENSSEKGVDIEEAAETATAPPVVSSSTVAENKE